MGQYIYTISTIFIVCRREVVGCVLNLMLLFVSVDGWIDGWLCRVDMVGVFFFFFFEEKTLCTQSVCVNATPFIHSCVPPRTLFSVSQLFDLPTALNIIFTLPYYIICKNIQ